MKEEQTGPDIEAPSQQTAPPPNTSFSTHAEEAGGQGQDVNERIAALEELVTNLRGDLVTKAYEQGLSEAEKAPVSEAEELQEKIKNLERRLLEKDFTAQVRELANEHNLHVAHLTNHLRVQYDIEQGHDGALSLVRDGKRQPLDRYVEGYANSDEGRALIKRTPVQPTGALEKGSSPPVQLSKEDLIRSIYGV